MEVSASAGLVLRYDPMQAALMTSNPAANRPVLTFLRNILLFDIAPIYPMGPIFIIATGAPPYSKTALLYSVHTDAAMKSNHWTQHWQHISASFRLLFISIAGLIVFYVLPSAMPMTIRLALSWITAGSAYLLLSYIMMYFSTEENMLILSKNEDDGATIILLITIFASVLSLVTIVMILSDIRLISIIDALWRIGLVLLTYAVSWLLVHTAFALHYAHAYYLEFEKTKDAPLLFENKLRPAYVDFLYFSVVIGMTCQTADVNIADSRMRFWVMIQGMTAFIFNASLLAMAINLISGVVTFK